MKLRPGRTVTALALTTLVSLGLGGSQAPAAGRSELPADFQSLSAEVKKELIWAAIEKSEFEGELPALEKVNPLKLVFSVLSKKMENQEDEAAENYEKPIHAHGVVAQVRFEAEPGSAFTGLFQGVDHALARFSVTGSPESMSFAPGIALKLLRDGLPSQNVSALYKLSGQDEDHNFFAHELSNVIPLEFDPASIFSSSVFARVSKYPTQISVDGFADHTQSGKRVGNVRQPRQLYFVPADGLAFASEAHDFREDFLGLPAGTVLYDVYATEEEGLDFGKINEARREKAEKVGRLVSASRFVASEYGDRRIFFKHNKMK